MMKNLTLILCFGEPIAVLVIGGLFFLNDDVHLGVLFCLLIILIILSAFFSSTETALMRLNRYRLRHRARSGNRAAIVTEKLLKNTDKLLGLILLGNNATHILSAALVTIISIRIGGESAIFIGTTILTFVLLIFAEVAPKTIAARSPSKLALPSSLIYYPLLKITYPLVWLVNFLSNLLLILFGVNNTDEARSSISTDELKTIVSEETKKLQPRHRNILLNVLDLEDVTVDDIMVPRQEIVGIDLDDNWNNNLEVIRGSYYNRLPIYRGDIDEIIGTLRVRDVLNDIAENTLNKNMLLSKLTEPYFIPEGTSLNRQLINFQAKRERIALIVDEYGDIQGLITTEDVVREIFGEFEQANPNGSEPKISSEKNGSFIIDAGYNIRQLNQLMKWSFPTDGPKTLNGLIIEEMETIPEKSTLLKIDKYSIEILKTSENAINKVRVSVEDKEKS